MFDNMTDEDLLYHLGNVNDQLRESETDKKQVEQEIARRRKKLHDEVKLKGGGITVRKILYERRYEEFKKQNYNGGVF